MKIDPGAQRKLVGEIERRIIGYLNIIVYAVEVKRPFHGVEPIGGRNRTIDQAVIFVAAVIKRIRVKRKLSYQSGFQIWYHVEGESSVAKISRVAKFG